MHLKVLIALNVLLLAGIAYTWSLHIHTSEEQGDAKIACVAEDNAIKCPLYMDYTIDEENYQIHVSLIESFTAGNNVLEISHEIDNLTLAGVDLEVKPDFQLFNKANFVAILSNSAVTMEDRNFKFEEVDLTLADNSLFTNLSAIVANVYLDYSSALTPGQIDNLVTESPK